jgi:hypothetical protein
VSPEVTQIVDLYHVRQLPHDLVGILEFTLGDQRDDWAITRPSSAGWLARRVFPG